VEFNRKAFAWGRRAAVNLQLVEKLASPADVVPISQALSRDLGELVTRRAEFLAAYQDAAYARRYTDLIERVRAAETRLAGDSLPLTEAVARYYFKLLAYKDEYEVARLHSDPAFRRRIETMFEGDYRLRFHLAPPLLAKRDPATGELRKSAYGPWMMTAFRVLAKLKGLRGTALDVFGYSEERRTERRLIAEYERTVDELLARLDRGNRALAVEIASIPERIRGFGHVKARHLAEAKKKEAELLSAFRNPREQPKAA
jgi:indolepyruvate ferredoxin oxidoreductase